MRRDRGQESPYTSVSASLLASVMADQGVPRGQKSLATTKMMAITCAVWLTSAGSAVAASKGADQAVVQELRQNTKALLDAIAPGNVGVWNRLLDDRALQVDENDVVRTKSEVLATLTPLGAGLTGSIEIDAFQVALAGKVAVVTHEDREYLDYHGQVIRSRFRMTDTWIKTPKGWRVIGSQVLAVLQDPPSVQLDASVLCSYAGRYALTDQIVGTIRCSNGELTFERAGRPARRFLAEVQDVFFEPGAPRTRRIFQRDKDGRVSGFADRREARDIVWTRMDDAGSSPP